MFKLSKSEARPFIPGSDPSSSSLPFSIQTDDDVYTGGSTSPAVASPTYAPARTTSSSSVPSSQTVSIDGATITFQNSYDSTVTAAYQACIVAAEMEIETLFQGQHSETITATFTQGNAGANGAALGNSGAIYSVPYSTLIQYLPSSDVLPSSDPAPSGTWNVSESWARMLGMPGSGNGNPDDSVSLNTYYSTNYKQDAINGLVHELSEGALGRQGGLGGKSGATGGWYVMDLFRYNSAGKYDDTDGRDGKTTYFSTDGGKTLSLAAGLSFYNNYTSSTSKFSGGDSDDWNQQAVFGSTGGGETLTLVQTELNVMSALGWTINLPEDYFNGNGNWEVAANWGLGFQPITPEDVFIGSFGPDNIPLPGFATLEGNKTSSGVTDDDVTINSLSVGALSQLYIGDDATLTVSFGSIENPETTSMVGPEGNDGMIYVEAGGELELGFAYTNKSVLWVGFSGDGGTGTLDLLTPLALSGGGAVILGEADDSVQAVGDINGVGLINVDNHISGSGAITLLQFDNQSKGVVEASQPGGPLTIDVPLFTNEGRVDVDPGAQLNFNATPVISNSGKFVIGNSSSGGVGTLTFESAATLSGAGTIDLGEDASGKYSQGDITGAAFVNVDNHFVGAGEISSTSFDNQAKGVIEANQPGGSSNTALAFDVKDVSNEGNFNVDPGAILSFIDSAQTITNSNTITLGDNKSGGNGELRLSGATTLTGGGTLNVGIPGNQVFSSGSILGTSGASLANVNNTITGGGEISIASLDNQSGGYIDASQSEGDDLSISVSTKFTNEGELNIEDRAAMDLGADGETESLVNTGLVALGFDGQSAGLTDATLSISGTYQISGSGSLAFKGAGAAITSDGSAATFINESTINATSSGEIGDAHLTFENEGTVYANGAVLTINTGGNAVEDVGGTLEAEQDGTLILQSAVQTGVDYIPLLHEGTPTGGQIVAASGGEVEVAAAVSAGPPPSLLIRQVSGDVVVDAGSQVIVEADGSVSIPIEIEGSSGGTAGGSVTLDAGGVISGEIVFESGGGKLEVDGSAETVNVSGGGGSIALTSASQVLNLSNTGSDPVTLTASSDTLNFSDAEASLSGDDNVVTFATGSTNSLALQPNLGLVDETIQGYAPQDALAINGLDPAYQPADPNVAPPTSFVLSVAGNTATQTNSDGSQQVTTYNITGQEFTQRAIDENAKSEFVAKYFSHVSGAGFLSAFEYLYAGDTLSEKIEFYSGITGAPYTAEETDYDAAGRLLRAAFSDLTAGQPYSSYEYDYVGGVFAGSKFTYTTVPSGAAYSSYETDYDENNALTGEKFFYTDVTGQSYTGEEEDLDASGNLTRVLLTGVTGQAYSSLEEDFSGGSYIGDKAFYTNVTGESYTSEEVDASASGQLEKVVYSGMTSTPYSSVEVDYSAGAAVDSIYSYTDVTGQSYNAYQVEENTSGVGLQETLDLDSGAHTLVALAAGQTLTSLGVDKMTGDGATTFVLNAIYGADTITNFNSADTLSLSANEFAQLSSAIGGANYAGGNAVLFFSDGDTLTLKNMTQAQLLSLTGNITQSA